MFGGGGDPTPVDQFWTIDVNGNLVPVIPDYDADFLPTFWKNGDFSLYKGLSGRATWMTDEYFEARVKNFGQPWKKRNRLDNNGLNFSKNGSAEYHTIEWGNLNTDQSIDVFSKINIGDSQQEVEKKVSGCTDSDDTFFPFDNIGKILIDDADGQAGLWDAKVKAGDGIAFTKQTDVVTGRREIVISSTGGSVSSDFSSQMNYGTDANLTVNQIINPPLGEGSLGTPNDSGNFFPNGARITGVQCAVLKFQTFGTGSLTFEFRSLKADGSRTGPINGGSGTPLFSFTVDLPNSSGATRYDISEWMRLTTPIDVEDNTMVFCVVSGFNASSATGAVTNLGYRISPEDI